MPAPDSCLKLAAMMRQSAAVTPHAIEIYPREDLRKASPFAVVIPAMAGGGAAKIENNLPCSPTLAGRID